MLLSPTAIIGGLASLALSAVASSLEETRTRLNLRLSRPIFPRFPICLLQNASSCSSALTMCASNRSWAASASAWWSIFGGAGAIVVEPADSVSRVPSGSAPSVRTRTRGAEFRVSEFQSSIGKLSPRMREFGAGGTLTSPASPKQ